jgi:hypothetical protein
MRRDLAITVRHGNADGSIMLLPEKLFAAKTSSALTHKSRNELKSVK